jgi:hypothetical protein
MMKVSTQLRPATIEDKEFMIRLVRAAVLKYWEKVPDWDESHIEEYYDNYFNPKHVLIIEYSDEPIGATSIVYRRKNICVVYLYLMPKFQDSDFKISLINRVLKRAKKEKKPVLTCVFKGDPQDKEICDLLGFEVFMEDEFRWRVKWTPPLSN